MEPRRHGKGLCASLALLLACAVGGGGTGARVGSAAGARAAVQPADLARIEREVHAGVNRHRRTAGLPALASDPRIAEIARTHSRAMASGRSRFGHGGFRERTRLVEGRIPYQRVAENVARYGLPPAEIPAVSVHRWVKSRGHRRNIEGRFAVTGVGAAVGRDGSIYLTQLFVAPR